MPLGQIESCNDKPQMPRSLAMSVTTGSRVLAEGRLHRSRREPHVTAVAGGGDPIYEISTFRIGSPRNNPVFQRERRCPEEENRMVFFLWSGFEGKGGVRRKTVWFSSFGGVLNCLKLKKSPPPGGRRRKRPYSAQGGQSCVGFNARSGPPNRAICADRPV